MVGFTLLLFIVGLWPFNFTDKNEARINPEEGLIIAKPGTVYAAVPSVKLHNLRQFTICINLATSTNGLSAFERIFSYAINHKDMNFIAGQWKDGLSFHLPDENRQRVIHFGAEGLLRMDERTTLLISYDGMKLVLLQDGRARIYRETGPLTFSSWSREYPLIIGTDADGKAQWKGVLYEAAIYDRALTSSEVMRLSSPSSLSGLSGGNKAGTRDERVGTGAAERRGKTADSKEVYSRQPTADSEREKERKSPSIPLYKRGRSRKVAGQPAAHSLRIQAGEYV